jgi:hypothetical protein
MRIALSLLAAVGILAVGALAASAAAAAPPTYSVSFTGSGSERQLDHQQNIQDSGLCDSAEHLDVTASLAWTATWPGLRATGRVGGMGPSRIDGSKVAGSDVKDACGLDLSLAPPGWVAQRTCTDTLAVSAAPAISVRKTKASLVLAVAAPSFAVPVGAGCSLNVRNDQLTAHAVVPLKKLQGLQKHGSIVIAVGTVRPGPGDTYARTIDCSQPTKPYDGYRTADHCQDDLSWSGTVTVTRTS